MKKWIITIIVVLVLIILTGGITYFLISNEPKLEDMERKTYVFSENVTSYEYNNIKVEVSGENDIVKINDKKINNFDDFRIYGFEFIGNMVIFDVDIGIMVFDEDANLVYNSYEDKKLGLSTFEGYSIKDNALIINESILSTPVYGFQVNGEYINPYEISCSEIKKYENNPAYRTYELKYLGNNKFSDANIINEMILKDTDLYPEYLEVCK